MKVCIALRGGLGDTFVWLPKIVAALEHHKKDDVHIRASVTWPEAVKTYLEALDTENPPKSIVTYEHGRPFPREHVDDVLIGMDLIYHMDAWKGARGQYVREVNMVPASRVFPWLVVDPYPKIKIPGDRVGGTVIQVTGRSIGAVMNPTWWKDGLKHFPGPVRLLGDLPQKSSQNIEDYGCESQVRGPVDIFAAIKSAKVMVGIDSGFRNIAMITKTPVLEIKKDMGPNNPGYPDPDVFVPKCYRKRVLFIDLDIDLDPPLLSTALPELNKMIDGAKDE